ncbi:hypothetical protein LNP26_27405 [Klebsiella variicola subsp. variicola]|nr:hypothetical protein [Klebsiella variicola subsp. variicola]
MLPVCRGAGPSHALAMSMNSISPSGITFIFSLPVIHFTLLRCRIAGKYDVLSTESHFFVEDSWHARRSGASGRSVIHIRHNDMTKTGGLYFSFFITPLFFTWQHKA